MHARVTHTKSEPAKVDEGIRFSKENAPNANKQPGFKGHYWLADRTTGKGIGITLWESEAAMRASDEAAKQTADKATTTGLQVTGVVSTTLSEAGIDHVFREHRGTHEGRFYEAHLDAVRWLSTVLRLQE